VIRFLRWLQRALLLRVHDAIIGHSFNSIVERRLIRAGRVTLGPHTYGHPIIKDFAYDETKLFVGSYSSLSETAIVMIGGDHGADRVTTYAHRIIWNMPGAGQDGCPVPSGDTYIGSDVWLCQRAFVRSGSRIGDGAVIAAGAVVTKDVPPFAIVARNPARIIRNRHTPEQIEALLQVKWWDWPDADVRDAVPLLSGTDVDAFIAWARANKAHLIPSNESHDVRR
jgi:chloramphenicol O-acetyltransferase type B